MIKAMLIAGAGGFVGTCGRYLVGKWCSGMFHGAFPMGTFMVNIIGCFLIGLFFGLLEKAHVMTPGENVLLITASVAVSQHFPLLLTTCGFSVIRAIGQPSLSILASVWFSACCWYGQGVQSSDKRKRVNVC